MMREAPRLETARLILRARTNDDFPAFAAMQANADYNRHIAGAVVAEEEAWGKFTRMAGHWPLLGYGYWAIEERATGRFVGEAGLMEARRAITPSHVGVPEAGWGLAPEFWGRGLASEAISAMLAWADKTLDADATCCIINKQNAASFRVAAKLGYRLAYVAQYKGGEVDVFRRERRR